MTRGLCKVAEGHTHVQDVVETSGIIKIIDAEGKVGAKAGGRRLNPETYVSMNFWGFPCRSNLEIDSLAESISCGSHAETDSLVESLSENLSENYSKSLTESSAEDRIVDYALDGAFISWYMSVLEHDFIGFFKETVSDNPLKAEFLLPTHIGRLLREDKVTVKVLETSDKWFGVTYQEDKPAVVESIRELIKKGVYQEELYSDL